MTQTVARIKQAGKHFEIIVDLDKALKCKNGQSNSVDFLDIDKIFSDYKKGFVASTKDIKEAFGTLDVNQIALKIVKNGEVLVTQEHRNEEKEKKIKQVIDFLSRNAIDPKTERPHTPERIKTALEHAHVNIKNSPIDSQINEIIESISKIIPIKLETKKIRIIVPSMHTGKVYGLLNQYKQEENWLDNGDLETILVIPSGLIIDFYEKLNAVTHGSAITEEIKGK